MFFNQNQPEEFSYFAKNKEKRIKNRKKKFFFSFLFANLGKRRVDWIFQENLSAGSLIYTSLDT